METDPSLEFDFFLAEKLRMTVAEMRSTVDGQEYLEWSIYYGRKAQNMELARLSGGGR